MLARSFMQQLGKYTVIRRLGVGGMAEVFLCKLVGIGGFEKHVVVKKIKADIASDDEFITMFFDEARLAANLNHPNIIQVFEVDALDGLPYLAMEYVRGSTLSALLAKLRTTKQPMHVGHLAHIFSGVCAGLDHAHNARDASGRPLTIVHRDISPTNIIVSVDGTPKIFDFGVAKARGSLSLTGVDRVKGKFAYMAPEQLRAQPVDSKADIYAVGVCMYEAITGRRPFSGATEAELYAARLEGRFKMPSELAPTIPVDLEHLILSAMARDPADRPRAIELQDQLAAFCGAGSQYASNSLAVAQWLKDTVGEYVEAYEGYSSSNPSMTPLPRSANLPRTTSAVEAKRSGTRGTMIAAATLAGAAGLLAAVLVVVLVKREAVQPSAAPAQAATATQTEEAERRARERELQHQHDLEAMRTQLDEAKRAQTEQEPQPAAAVSRAPVERTVERKQEPERKSETKTKARAAKSIAVSPKAADRAEAAAPPATSGSGSAQQIAAQVPPPAPAAGSATSGSAAPRPAPSSGSAAPRPAPPPVAKIAAPVTPAPAIANRGSLDAVPAIAKLSVDGSLTTTEVQNALSRTMDALRSCYRGAAKKANQTPEVSVKVTFDIDEGARATSVRVSSDTFGVGSCVKDAIGGIRTRVAPDVGIVSVSAVVRFKPTP